MDETGFESIKAKVSAVRVEPHMSENNAEKIDCISVMYRVIFIWNGVSYEKEIAPISARDVRGVEESLKVGKNCTILFNPHTEECKFKQKKWSVKAALGFCALFVFAVMLFAFLWDLFENNFPRLSNDIGHIGLVLFCLLLAIALLCLAVKITIPVHIEEVRPLI